MLHWPPHTCALVSSLRHIIQSGLPVGLIKPIISNPLRVLSLHSAESLQSGSTAALVCEVE